jgi:hypothetical protein
VYGQSGTVTGYGVYGYSSDGYGYAVRGECYYGFGVYGQSSTGYAVYAEGDFGATGTKAALVPAENSSLRALYCVESPECWFEDFGTAQLVGGSARVQIEPLFAATVRTERYHIFLTPQGDSNGLYVSEVDAFGFSVHEQHGGTSSLVFSYRVVALRKDVAAPRLVQVRLWAGRWTHRRGTECVEQNLRGVLIPIWGGDGRQSPT